MRVCERGVVEWEGGVGALGCVWFGLCDGLLGVISCGICLFVCVVEGVGW